MTDGHLRRFRFAERSSFGGQKKVLAQLEWSFTLILAEPLSVVAEVAGAFDKLGVRYLVGGSLASSVYGIPRATQDVDLVADLPSTLVDAFCSLLQDAFYIDGDMIREAIQRKASFNIVHIGTMSKADVFIMKGDSWSRACEKKRSRVSAGRSVSRAPRMCCNTS